ncbi:MAG: LPD7 domain-containing protein [Methylobacter sp.]
MSYGFALLPVKQAKKPSLFFSLFSKKEKIEIIESSDTQRRKQKVTIDYVALFQPRSEQNGFAYYENNSKNPVFSASKDKITVHKLEDNAIRAGLQLASASFGEIRVDGPDDVRRQVWLQGQAIGIDVAGYDPSEKDQAAADKLRQSLTDATATAQISAASEPVNSAPASPVAAEPEVADPEEPVAQPRQPDILVEHGAEPYEFDEKNKMSYYVAVRNPGGEIKTYWGVDLERAISEGGAEPGDQITLDRLGKTKVKITDPKTKAVSEVDRVTWQVDVIEKAAVLAHKEAIAAARNAIGADAQIYQAKTNGGASVGSIIHINQRYAVQQVEDKSSAIIHDLTKLSGAASIGQRVNIQYDKDGIGKVELFDKTKEQFAQLFANELEPDYEYEND